MILRVYAMWNQSKRILYILLFIYVPQVIVPLVVQCIYAKYDTYLSGMSQAKLQAKFESHIWPHGFYHLFLQPQLCKLLLMLHFANFQWSPAMPHYNYCGALKLSE